MRSCTYDNKYPDNFIFLILKILELFTRKVCEMFVYKYAKTIEYVKNQSTFKEKYEIYR